jgi:hypothetical protein
MKKSLVWISLVVLLTGVAACGSSDDKSDGTSSGSDTKSNTDTSTNPKDLSNKANACEILTAEVARKFFGGATEDVQEAPAQNPTGDVMVTNCNYMEKAKNGSAMPRQAGLLLRAGQNDAGVKDNENGFKQQRTKKDKDVPGIGDSAFWSPSYGQLNVLKGDNWYIITAGGVLAKDRTLADAKKLAGLFNDKL